MTDLNFQQYLPIDMQSGGTGARSVTSALRRLERAKRIAAGLRPAKITDYGKRYERILAKVRARDLKMIKRAAQQMGAAQR